MGKDGGVGGERGKNRDATDWHEGLRLLAALRQLGGVRRGIEIANAHYGYFPIEGRIPLPVSYHASRSFSFRPHPLPRLSLSFSLYLALPSATSLSYPRALSPPCSLSPFRSFTPYTHQPVRLPLFLFPSLSLSLLSLSIFPRVALHSILPHLCLLAYRPATSFLPLALFFPGSRVLSFFSPPRPLSLAQRKRIPKSARSRSHLSVSHSSLSLTFSLRTRIVFPPRSIIPPSRSVPLPVTFPFSHLCASPSAFVSSPIFPSTRGSALLAIRAKHAFSLERRVALLPCELQPEAAADSRPVSLGYFVTFTLSSRYLDARLQQWFAFFFHPPFSPREGRILLLGDETVARDRLCQERSAAGTAERGKINIAGTIRCKD